MSASPVNPDSPKSFLRMLASSYLIKILLIGFLILLLQIPIVKIQSVIQERERTRGEAIAEVTEKWGNSQQVIGPFLIVPYTLRWAEKNSEGVQETYSREEFATFLPEDLTIEGKLANQVLERGIYEIPVYRMSLQIKGKFLRPDLSKYISDASAIHWDRANLVVRVADARALSKQTSMSWNEQTVPLLPSTGAFGQNRQGIHAELGGLLEGETFDFAIPLEMGGSFDAFFAPFGRETAVSLKSDWQAPSFQGAWLPSEREFGEEGFSAEWNVASLGRNYPQDWNSQDQFEEPIQRSLVGVAMISPVDEYRMAHRSVKYQFLFLVLTFVALWMFEIRIPLRIHSIQYLFVGAALCLFYLLELSLAEHIGFLMAYIIASAAVVGLIAAYAWSMLRTLMRAFVVGLVVAFLYGFLYILLTIQDVALLVGSVGLFVALATVMYLTRNLDWNLLADEGHLRRKIGRE